MTSLDLRIQQTFWNLSVVIRPVNQELLGAWGRGNGHGRCSLFISGVVTQVLTCQPGLISLRLEPLDKAVHADVDSVWSTEAPRGSLPELDPPRRGEIGALRRVEARVEARVVAAGEGYHNLALVLHDLVVGDAVLAEDHGTNHAHFVTKVG